MAWMKVDETVEYLVNMLVVLMVEKMVVKSAF
jgi:hypothetical protein